MAEWAKRTTGYKVGVFTLFVGALLFFVGFASPVWLKNRGFYSGLWLSCHSYYGSCRSIYGGGSWLSAVQAFQCLCLIGLFLSITYFIIVNHCQTSLSTLSFKRLLEVLAGASGVSGFIGAMIYVGNAFPLRDLYNWSMALDISGCLLIIVAAIIIFMNNNPVEASMIYTGDQVVTERQPMQGGNTIIMQNMQSQPYPPPQPPAGAFYGYPQAHPQVAYGIQPAPAQAGYGMPGYSAHNYPHGYSGQPYYR